MRSRRRTVLITSASRSRESDIHRRELRYLASMAFRVVCLVFAVVAFHGWLRFVAVAIAVVMPWIAVVVANGPPAPERQQPVTFDPQQTVAQAPAALSADPHTVVDSEGWVDEQGWVHGTPGRPTPTPTDGPPAAGGTAESAGAGSAAGAVGTEPGAGSASAR
ncbi:DUF3099 domain-containing protein [Frankia sp. AgKG'84/4]|uniref:DUF3099 domain-containing protein n=1 Tax=Frankia sp. AgKG'84/4 TaxID=573490 RepID=UPI00200DBC20|nr:DUF3099 domain-containing protein [Frankia sp. AgKG'84/4]MCL9797977.1 DUF3099 domain-containing protein [Frankia sp. AgKG'84/4]